MNHLDDCNFLDPAVVRSRDRRNEVNLQEEKEELI